MKKIKWVILILLVIAVIGVYGYNRVNQMTEERVAAMPSIYLDIAQVKDGNYTGQYKSSPVEVEVQVMVSDSKITQIDILKHECGLGRKAESIVDLVVLEQNLEVDSVSGATLSSQVILKAIENALEKGL